MLKAILQRITKAMRHFHDVMNDVGSEERFLSQATSCTHLEQLQMEWDARQARNSFYTTRSV